MNAKFPVVFLQNSIQRKFSYIISMLHSCEPKARTIAILIVFSIFCFSSIFPINQRRSRPLFFSCHFSFFIFFSLLRGSRVSGKSVVSGAEHFTSFCFFCFFSTNKNAAIFSICSKKYKSIFLILFSRSNFIMCSCTYTCAYLTHAICTQINLHSYI